jgi:DNA-binding transcriptional LysR family regulator
MRTYAAVVETGSFTRAAERLGISKALTSKYLGQLEEHLGVRLLHRTTRKLNPTEAGGAYYQRCRQLLDELDELEAAVRQQQESPQGQLRITAATTFGETYLTPIVADYLKQQPGVSVELVLADRFVNLVDEGFDLAVRIGSLTNSSLIAKRLASIQMVLCASPEYLRDAGTPSHPLELTTHNCVIDSNLEDPLRWIFKEEGVQLEVKVNGHFRVNSAQAVRQMLLSGEGIGLCPRYAVEKDLHNRSLRSLLQNYLATEYGIYVVYSHNRHLAAKVRTFVDFLANHLS